MQDVTILNSTWRINPGEIVEVIYSTYIHYALASDKFTNGKPNLIALTKRKGSVYEESWEEGAQGATVRKSHIQGALSGCAVLERARSLIGKENYSLLTNNCEHFVRWAHGLPIESKQVVGGLTGSTVLGLVGYKMFNGHKGMTLGMLALGGIIGVAMANQGK